MYASKFNIFCTTETWLCDTIPNGEIIPSGYSLYRKDRPSRGGGVLIAVNDSIPILLISSPPDLEIVSVIIGSKKQFILCTVYVCPNCSFSYLVSLLSLISNLNNQCGDLNFPDICWSFLTGSSPLFNYFCEFVYDHNLYQHVLEPTHIRGNTLDLVLTTSGISVSNLLINPPNQLFLSDHYIISFCFKCEAVSSLNYASGYVFDFFKADLDSLCSCLLDVDFSACFLSSDIEFVW